VQVRVALWTSAGTTWTGRAAGPAASGGGPAAHVWWSCFLAPTSK